jgi:phage terminase large subunit-like protein
MIRNENAISVAERLLSLSNQGRSSLLGELDEAACRELLFDWNFWARQNQLPPTHQNWSCWLVLAGRGFGKTRMGAEWVRSMVSGSSPLQAPHGSPQRIALVAETSADGREVMIDGESGLLAIFPADERPVYEASRRRLVWLNGTVAHLYSASEPDQLRGPQHGFAWVDELAKWSNAEEVWANLLMGLRLGRNPRTIVTTTPRPVPLIRKLLKDKTTLVTRGSTFDNAAHLPAQFMSQISRLYGGTRLGRQELEGELIDDVAGALWSRSMIEAIRRPRPEDMERIVVAVDPPVSGGPKADSCGIVAVGRAYDGNAYVLADESVQGLSPVGWAKKALKLYKDLQADRLVAEVNNGGDLVENLLRQIEPNVAYQSVHARRGKMLRAEPVAALYEQEKVFHCSPFPALEDEMCSYTGEKGTKSPDRLDALVWAVWNLMLSSQGNPRILKL